MSAPLTEEIEESVAKFLAIEPLHFSFKDISRRKEEYRNNGDFVRRALHSWTKIGEAQKICVMIDDIPSHNIGVEPIRLREVLRQLEEIGIIPDLCIHETELRPLAIRIINSLPVASIKLHKRALKLELPFTRPLRLAVYATRKNLDRTDIDPYRTDIEPSCPVYTLAWYYFLVSFHFDRKRGLVSSVQSTQIQLDRPPINKVVIMLSGVFFNQEYRASLIAPRSSNEHIQMLQSPIRIFYPASPIEAAEYSELP